MDVDVGSADITALMKEGSSNIHFNTCPSHLGGPKVQSRILDWERDTPLFCKMREG